jgi:hypothetical protein
MNKSKLYEQAVKKTVSIDAKQIAKKIYDAKGIFLDDETAAVKAIQQIPDNTQFNLVQKELQKLTGGKGIGQYVTSFIGHLEDVDTKGLGVYATGKFEGERTLPLLRSIIEHLKKIKADPKTITIFNTYLNTLENQFLTNSINAPETQHMVNTIGSIVSLVSPLGLPLSAAFELADAKQYYDEGKNYEAGLALVFALTPGFLKLGGKFAKGLVKKIVAKSGVLTKTEREFLTRAAMSKDLIKNKINGMLVNGIKNGTINPYAIKSTKWIQPVGKGLVKVGIGGAEIVATSAIYNKAYTAALPSPEEFFDGIARKNYEYLTKLLKTKLK